LSESGLRYGNGFEGASRRTDSEITHQLEAIHLIHSRLEVQPLGRFSQLARDILCIARLASIEDSNASAANHGRLYLSPRGYEITHFDACQPTGKESTCHQQHTPTTTTPGNLLVGAGASGVLMGFP